MKKVVKKSNTKNDDGIDLLAKLVRDGFERMDGKFAKIDERFEQVDARFDQIDARFEQIDRRFEQIDTQIFSINHTLQDHTKRLERIERRQDNMLINLDESVHRSEFKLLHNRVEVLEKKGSKK